MDFLNDHLDIDDESVDVVYEHEDTVNCFISSFRWDATYCHVSTKSGAKLFAYGWPTIRTSS